MSAVLNFPSPKATLDQLVEQWIAAKRDEDAANARRVQVEQQMCELHPPKEEGATTVEVGGYKVTLTGKLTYKADMPRLLELVQKLPEDRRPVKTETKLDETDAKYLRSKEPALWAIIAPAIEVKPAKTSVAVKV